MSDSRELSQSPVRWPEPISFAWQSEAEYLAATRDGGDIFDPDMQQRVLDRRQKVGKRVGHFNRPSTTAGGGDTMSVDNKPTTERRVEVIVDTPQIYNPEQCTLGPCVTPAQIDDTIAATYYFTAAQGARAAGYAVPSNAPPLGLLSLCVLVLKNGFTVTGESACASPENYDAEMGQRIALQKAKAKIWALEGYLLRERLSSK